MQELLDGERQPDGGDQDRLPETMAGVQRRDHGAPDDRAPKAGKGRSRRQRERDPGERIIEPEHQHEPDGADRPIGAEHRDLAEGQVDAAGDPIDQRIGGREQRIDGRQRDRVDELLRPVGDRRRQLRNRRLAADARAGIGRRSEPEALQEIKRRLRERTAVGLHRDEIEPIGRKRSPGEAAGHVAHMARLARRARHIIDAHALAAECRGPVAHLADFGAVGIEGRNDIPAGAQLLAVDRLGATGEPRNHEGEKKSCAHLPKDHADARL